MVHILRATQGHTAQPTVEECPVTVRRHLRTLARQLRRTRAALDMATDAVLVFVHPDLRLVDVNRAACVSLGYGQRELCSMRLADIAPQAADGPLGEAIARIVGEQVHFVSVVTVHRRKSGAEFLVEACVRRVEEKPRPAFVMVARHLCNGRRLDGRVPPTAFRDELTGLATRAWLESRLELAIDRKRRENRGFAIFFVDVDHFKRINDSWGHLRGDEILRAVAGRLTASVRPMDLVARYGGDEFIVLMDGVRDKCEVIQVARRISDRMKITTANTHACPEGQRITVTASIGVTMGSGSCRTASELIHRADRAMYRAKALGRKGHWVLDAESGAAK